MGNAVGSCSRPTFPYHAKHSAFDSRLRVPQPRCSELWTNNSSPSISSPVLSYPLLDAVVASPYTAGGGVDVVAGGIFQPRCAAACFSRPIGVRYDRVSLKVTEVTLCSALAPGAMSLTSPAAVNVARHLWDLPFTRASSISCTYPLYSPQVGNSRGIRLYGIRVRGTPSTFWPRHVDAERLHTIVHYRGADHG